MTDLNISDSRAPKSDSMRRPVPADETPMLELLRMWRVIFKNRKFIGVLSVIIAAALLSVFLLIPPKYHAFTSILIDPRGLRVVEKNLTPQSLSSGGDFAIIESQRRVMISDAVLRPVIIGQRLTSDPEFGGEKDNSGLDLRGLIYGIIGIEQRSQSPDLKALRLLWKATWTNRKKGTYVIELLVSTKHPAKSARIANAIAKKYVELEFTEHSKMANRAAGSIMNRLKHLRDRLREAEGRVEKYKASHNIINADGKLVNEQQLNQVNEELSAARAVTSKTHTRYEQIKLVQNGYADLGAIAEAVSSQTIKELRLRYTAARQVEMSLASQLLPGHPNMQRARAKVATVRREISSELRRIAGAARIDYDHANANEELLARKVDILKNNTVLTNEAQVKMRELMRDAEASRIVYNSFLVRARELVEQQGVDSSNARILSPAISPINPASPSLLLMIALSLAVGLGLSTLYVLTRDSVAPLLR
jgi:uncharacterized protein involved in exopolysaccharide biosynthesis